MMNVIKNSTFRRLNVQQIRTYHQDPKPFEHVPGRFVENRRYGYRSRYHEQGLYPRLRNQDNVVKSSYNEYRPRKLDWSQNKALMGQNDYIDILGKDSIKPFEIIKNVPWYLKGFRGNELEMLVRQQVAKEDWRISRPKKWKEMQGRIDFLYKYFNFRNKPPFLK